MYCGNINKFSYSANWYETQVLLRPITDTLLTV